MFEKKNSWVSRLGVVVASSALGMFIALPAFAEPPSHGFHQPPHPVPVVKAQKPHAPHPSLNPPPSGHKPHVTHMDHKPHPGLNPFTPPLHS